MSPSDPLEIQQWNAQRESGQGEIGVQVPPETKISIFQAILNVSKVYKRVELTKIAHRFNLPIESLISLVEDWLVSGVIYGQIISHDLVFTKINMTEEQFRQHIFGSPPSPSNPPAADQSEEMESAEQGTQTPVIFGEGGDITEEVQESSSLQTLTSRSSLGFVRLQVNIVNDSSMVISSIIIKFILPKNLRLILAKPSEYLKRQDNQAIVTIPSVPGKARWQKLFFT